MITVNQAYGLMMDSITQNESCKKDIFESLGQVLRERIVAERVQPPFHRVAMDGVALKLEAHDLSNIKSKRLFIENIQRAGRPQLELLDSENIIEVMTGSSLPIGCNCVVRYEDVELDNGYASFKEEATFSMMQNIHQKGEDFSEGEVLLAPGKIIKSVDIGVIVSQGLSQVEVGTDPRIAVISTGDELVDPGLKIEDYQIRRSNPYSIKSELIAFKFNNITLFHLSDSIEVMKEKLASIFDDYDHVILSGGVSKGKYDYVPEVLSRLGVEKVFHKIKQRPGKPFWYGQRGGKQSVFALPGNPVSSLVCLRRYVIPGLLKEKGLDEKVINRRRAIISEDITFNKDLNYFCPVILDYSSDNKTFVRPVDKGGSGDYFKLSKSEGFIELPKDRDHFKKGEEFPLFLWGVL